MKKLIVYLLTITALLSLAACGSKKNEEPASFDEEALKADAQSVADSLLSGDFEAVTAKFDEKMAAALDAATLKTGWEAAIAQLGGHIDRASVEGAAEGGYYAAVVTERFENNGLAIRVVYDAAGLIAGLQCNMASIPEDAVPQETDAYTEEAVTIAGDPQLPLAGILTLPKNAQKAPVVILVHGSGASDMDETVFGQKPFADIAHGLAQQGIATLRYDKRHFTYPENAAVLGASLTLREETLDDVNAAIELMKADERVDGESIFVLGHSLGGMLTPAIAAEHPELSGVISVAGTLRPMWEVVYDQNQEVIAATDTSALSEADKKTFQAQAAQVETDAATLGGDFSALADDAMLMGIPVGYWKSIKEYCGVNFIDEVTMPMLILQGSADFQVYPEKDFALWQETLEGRDNVSFKLYEGLNHLMMPTDGKRDVSDYQTAKNVDPQVIDDIAAFINGAK